MVSLMPFQSFRNYWGSQEILYHSLHSLHVFQHKIWLKNKELILCNAEHNLSCFVRLLLKSWLLRYHSQNQSTPPFIVPQGWMDAVCVTSIRATSIILWPPQNKYSSIDFLYSSEKVAREKLGEMKESSTLPVGFGKYQERGEAGV